MSEDSITARTARGATWLLSWRVLTRVLGLISTLVLARLLKPADFGVISLGVAMWTGIDSMTSLGVQEQLIREDHADKALFDTGFTLNFLRGIVLAAVMLLAARPLAVFFGDAQLTPVIWAMAAVLFLAGVENIWVVEYQRHLNFRMDFLLSAVPRLLASAVLIGTAFVFRDYRALIAGMLTLRLARCIYSYFLHSGRPSLTLRAWRRLTSFSLWTWANMVVGFLRNRSDSMIIARMIGAAPLGVYSIAQEIATLSFSELIAPISQVLFPGFAAVRQSGSKVDSAYARALGGAFLLVLPATIGTAFVAEPATLLLFGRKWLEAVPLIRVLSLTGTLMVCTSIGRTLLSSAGWPRINFQIILVATSVRVPLIVVLTLRFGMLGAAVAVLAATALEESLFLLVTLFRFQVPPATIFAQVWRPTAATAAMAAILAVTWGVWQPASALPLELLRSLAIAISEGAATYVAAMGLLWLAAGRPLGAEVEILQHGGKILGGAVRATRRRLVPALGGMR